MTIKSDPIPTVMCNFIEDYPADKARTLASARHLADKMNWCDSIDEETIYRQLASPEFRLYQEMIF